MRIKQGLEWQTQVDAAAIREQRQLSILSYVPQSGTAKELPLLLLQEQDRKICPTS